MRSRYSAFVRGDADYLLRSWHPSMRPPEVTIESVTWLGLKIVDHRRIGADRAEVEFVARSRTGGAPALRQHERSRFVREGGHWYYVDGELRD